MEKKNNEYRLIRLEIKSKYMTVDVRNLMMEFTIFNDMFLEFLTADLMIVDTLNLIKRLPIVGGEEVILEFQDQYEHTPVMLSFIAWKVSKQEPFTQANQVYKLHLISPNWYKSLSIKKLNRMKGNSAGEITKLLDETAMPVKHGHQFYVGGGPPEIELYAGNKTPFECMRHIMFNCHDGNHNPWILHHDLQSYRFETFQDCVSRPELVEIYLQPLHQEDYKEIDRTRISEDWFRLDNQNKIHIDQKGSQRTDNIIMSLKKKNLTFSEFDYQGEFGSLPTIEDVPLDRIDTPEYKKRCFILDEPKEAKEANHRTAVFTMVEDNILYVNISGDTQFTSGQILRMDIPSKETFIGGYKYEEDLSGRFLITSSKHIIKKDSYRTVVELMKESLVQQL